ncbi:MAG TPA: hypothetical protein PKD72_06255 [Gemmatales bacterium]|nr:hypothetical protein [Gemmatales bacterium]
MPPLQQEFQIGVGPPGANHSYRGAGAGEYAIFAPGPGIVITVDLYKILFPQRYPARSSAIDAGRRRFLCQGGG